ncbi:hypothetical protein V2G26_007438 [Clonostachys chloroleuca]
MELFTYQMNPSRVVFGSGTINRAPSELSRLKLSKPFLLSTPSRTPHIQDLSKVLEARSITPTGVFTEATMHTPVAVTEKAVAEAQAAGSDWLYHLCIPTTYAGSEVTPILGETEMGEKTTYSNPSILPGTVIYDVDLTMTLPVGFSAISGVNAIAHAVEAMYAENSNPIIRMLAQEGVRALAESLPQIINDPSHQDARQGRPLRFVAMRHLPGQQSLGVKEGDIPKIVAAAVKKPYYSPRAVEEKLLTELVRRAWAGELARADF